MGSLVGGAVVASKGVRSGAACSRFATRKGSPEVEGSPADGV